MDNPILINLGDKSPITVAVTDLVITLAPDADGINRSYIGGLLDMGSATFFAELVHGSGGTACILFIDTSLNQGGDWINIARIDFATANRLAAKVVSGAVPYNSDDDLTEDLAAEGTRNILGDMLRARVTTTGTYGNNTSIAVRSVVRNAAAGADDGATASKQDALKTLIEGVISSSSPSDALKTIVIDDDGQHPVGRVGEGKVTDPDAGSATLAGLSRGQLDRLNLLVAALGTASTVDVVNAMLRNPQSGAAVNPVTFDQMADLLTRIGSPDDMAGASSVIGQLKQIAANTAGS